MSSKLPVSITTSSNLPMSPSNFYDEEMSTLSVDTSAMSTDDYGGGRRKGMLRKDMFSISGRKLTSARKLIHSNSFFGGLKTFSTNLLSGGEVRKNNVNQEGKCENEEDSTIEGSTQCNSINYNENESCAREIPDDDCSKKSSMTDLHVEFPDRIRQKSTDPSPVGMTIQSFTGMFLPNQNKSPSDVIGGEETQKRVEAIQLAPPTRKEHTELEEQLMKAKLELAMVQEKMDNMTSRMSRVTKERNWLRTQYSTLQYKFMSAQASITENDDDDDCSNY